MKKGDRQIGEEQVSYNYHQTIMKYFFNCIYSQLFLKTDQFSAEQRLPSMIISAYIPNTNSRFHVNNKQELLMRNCHRELLSIKGRCMTTTLLKSFHIHVSRHRTAHWLEIIRRVEIMCNGKQYGEMSRQTTYSVMLKKLELYFKHLNVHILLE